MTQEAKEILAGTTPRKLAALPPKLRLRELLAQNRTAIMAAMPRHMNPDRLLRVAQTACTSTPKLMECHVPSLLGGIMQAAQFGLEPNTPMGHCYLVPYRRNLAKRGQPPQHRQDAQLIIGYRGLIDLARRSGQIVSISAHCVRDGDLFEWEFGLDEKLRHRPADGERGEITHVYAVAKLQGGGHAFEVMSLADVNKIMTGTQSRGKYGPWLEHFEEMARKTAIRRLAKYLPMTVEMAQASAGETMRSELSGDGTVDSVVLDGVSFDEGFSDQAAAPDPAPGQSEPAAEARHQAQERDAADWPSRVVGPDGTPCWQDSAGERYDPARHATARDGRPAVVSGGRFRARRGAAKDPPPPVPARPADGGGDGGAAPVYEGPSVDDVMRMIRENVADFDGVADVQAILADMPGALPGKDLCVLALDRREAELQAK